MYLNVAGSIRWARDVELIAKVNSQGKTVLMYTKKDHMLKRLGSLGEVWAYILLPTQFILFFYHAGSNSADIPAVHLPATTGDSDF
jgi:hypothetical protein